MSFKSKVAGAGIGLGVIWGVWQLAQSEAEVPGSTSKRTENLFNTLGANAQEVPEGFHGVVIKPGSQIAGEVGTVAGAAGAAGKAAGGAVAENAVPEAPKAGG